MRFIRESKKILLLTFVLLLVWNNAIGAIFCQHVDGHACCVSSRSATPSESARQSTKASVLSGIVEAGVHETVYAARSHEQPNACHNQQQRTSLHESHSGQLVSSQKLISGLATAIVISEVASCPICLKDSQRRPTSFAVTSSNNSYSPDLSIGNCVIAVRSQSDRLSMPVRDHSPPGSIGSRQILHSVFRI